MEIQEAKTETQRVVLLERLMNRASQCLGFHQKLRMNFFCAKIRSPNIIKASFNRAKTLLNAVSCF
jgi:hypothetical protein